MTALVMHREPAHQPPAPARALGGGEDRCWHLAPAQPVEPAVLPGRPAYSRQLLTARAEALFAGDLSAQRKSTKTEAAAATRHAIGTHDDIGGYAGEAAAAYGERPETAAHRMCWAQAVVGDVYAGQLAGRISRILPGGPAHGCAPEAAVTVRGFWRCGTTGNGLRR
jgi:hypothetical protein